MGIQGLMKTIVIKGMSCGHCAARVEKSLNKINGIEAKVDLESRTAKLNLTEPVTNQQIIDAVDDAGYEVVEIIGV